MINLSSQQSINQVGFILIIILTIGCNSQKPSPVELVEKYNKTIVSHTSINYSIDYRMKYFDNDDTIYLNAKVVLIKDPADTLFGGTIWIDNDSIERYYDLEYIYIINHKKREIKRFDAHNGQDWAINGNTIGNVIEIYFLNSEKLIYNINDSTNNVANSDTLMDKVNMAELTIKFADDTPFVNPTKHLFFKQQNGLLQKMSYYVEFQNQFQYNEWNLSNIEFDKIGNTALKDKLNKLVKEYEVIDYEAPDKEDYELLENGTSAPDFDGIYFKDDKIVHLSDFKGKIVLLDFWYMSCYPCVMAIPHLSELNIKFARKDLVILGLNPMDNSKKGKKKLPGFIETNKMNYPAVLIEKETAEAFNVSGYPTFYIIDKTGKVAFSHIGYGDETPAIIDSVLASLIN